MPCLDDDLFVLQNHVPNLVEFSWADDPGMSGIFGIQLDFTLDILRLMPTCQVRPADGD